jgi:hypothetical protein
MEERVLISHRRITLEDIVKYLGRFNLKLSDDARLCEHHYTQVENRIIQKHYYLLCYYTVV